MAERLRDKVAVVVGAGSIGPGWGNGKATAVLFAREGAKVVCADINPDAVAETAELIRGEGGEALEVEVDATQQDQVQALVAAAVDAYGGIDVLDNNIGITEVGGVVELPEEQWDRVLAINLKSFYLAMKHVIPVMLRGGGGSIVNISSIASIRWTGVPYATYYASKGAINQLTKATAMEYARRKIRVNAVLPGLMKTPMVEKSIGLAAAYSGGDVDEMWLGPRRAVPDGPYGRRLGRRQRGAVPRR